MRSLSASSTVAPNLDLDRVVCVGAVVGTGAAMTPLAEAGRADGRDSSWPSPQEDEQPAPWCCGGSRTLPGQSHGS